MAKSKYKYTIVNDKDISNIGARRVSVVVKLDEEYSKDQIKEIITELTKKYKRYKYESFKGVNLNTTKSDVIYLYIAENERNIEEFDYVARTLWWNKKIDQRYRPIPVFGNERIDDIEIRWRNGEEIWEN